MATAADPWYRPGLRFACTGCGRCCSGKGYVWVDRPQTRAIARHLGLGLEEFSRRYLRRVAGRYSLTEKPGGTCVFWEDGCRIYPVRPRQCRTFPFWNENVESAEAWEEVAGECEGMNQGRLYRIGEIGRLLRGEGAAAEE